MSTLLGPIPGPAAWTFTQGFLFGQATVILLGLLFVRYVVFSAADAVDPVAWRQRRQERAKKALLSTTAVPPPPTSYLLDNTGYDMSTHPAESADWINVVGAQILQGYRNDLLSSGGEEGARKQFERWLNPPGRTLSWLDPIEVTSVNLGKTFPLLSNARMRPADDQGRIRCEIDVDFADSISLIISTAVVVNFPRPRFAVLPVQIGVELVSVGGTLSVQIHHPKDDRQHLHVCLLPDFHLNLKTTSLLGSRAKLQDIPKLEQLILARLRAVIQDRFVFPHHLTFGLPRLLSRPEPDAVPVIPTETDLRTVALTVMSQGIGRLGQDLADRVAALAPTDSASAMASEDIDTSASTVDAEDDEIIIAEEIERAPRRLPPQLAPVRPGNVSSASSGAPGPAGSVSVSSAVPSMTKEEVRRRMPPLAGERRMGALNSHTS
ncbi:hypothetical protein CcaverHIS002_0107430 [Cutaneotrichosporon cavernicola]|uniref:Maintenance of mitochondrial morphology protein 1 n=1 Tax=Cutaneotrichosporon cavernicola TaxID=279322 RepID=A0AA48I1U5_9TREE|nr:uncharacterized protein CcaverHIS019_0107370 [Cutaneotrichosporon cavernicola]BEI80214.1 hypothetical protein CcaverHIS002_0107430 [Cutaneotrichosporon cavernicola]BEI88019.1 hypothetical protein CcaverHIS019_0107370 [Cutaneotrichosporon cavernicola]BEI95793.1 hypothetical protein CcaverHIS631_0107420 [Cutaneotrichosporon cavernicola]BEJ03566.1 hypothetical protein CcaverHIS641_0107410 [Cutaneotrichosporon cavernicola]